jgi:hypothetical protein
MAGVEIKPGVWIQSADISEITVEFQRDMYERASARRWKFEKDKGAWLAKAEQFREYDPPLVESIMATIEKEERENPKPEFADFKKVVVTMSSGRRHVVETDLYETLGIAGWDDSVQ